MPSVKLGVIGCGMIAQVMHLPHLSELEDEYELAALCDLSPRLVQEMATRYRVPRTYTDYREMLEKADLDAVIVLTRRHFEPVLAALTAGKHVLVEKPMCDNLDEADQLVAAADKGNLKLMVAYHRRYDPGVIYGLEQIRKLQDVQLIRLHQVIGPNAHFLAHYRIVRYDDLPAEVLAAERASTQAAYREALGDVPPQVYRAYGMAIGASVHDVTLLRGAFDSPRATLGTEIWGGGGFFETVMDYGDGVRALFHQGSTKIRYFDDQFTVVSPEKVVKITFPSTFLRNFPTVVNVFDMQDGRAVNEQVEASYEEAFKQELRHFHTCITTGQTPVTNGREGRKDLQLIRDWMRAYKPA